MTRSGPATRPGPTTIPRGRARTPDHATRVGSHARTGGLSGSAGPRFGGRASRRPRYARIVPATLPERPDPAEDLFGAQGGGHVSQLGALVPPGDQDPDDLGGIADRTGVGAGVLLVSLVAGGEPEVGGEPADLVEPSGRFPGGVVAGEGVGDGADQVGVQAAEAGVGGIGDQLEQLREEVAEDGPEI